MVIRVFDIGSIMDINFDDVSPYNLLILLAGVLMGYITVALFIDLEIYYVQSRVVTAVLYERLRDVEKASQVREASHGAKEVVTS